MCQPGFSVTQQEQEQDSILFYDFLISVLLPTLGFDLGFSGFAAICGFICGLVIVSLCQACGRLVFTTEHFIKNIARIANASPCHSY